MIIKLVVKGLFPFFYIRIEEVYAFFLSECCCIKAKVVVVYIAPGIVGVEIVVVGAAFVCLAYSTAGFLLGHIIASHESLDPFFSACVKEELNEAGIVTEDIIGAATHNDTGSLICN